MKGFSGTLQQSASTGSGTNDDGPYDEEGLYWHSGMWRGRRSKVPGKKVLCLLLVDLILIGLLIKSLEPLITLLRRNKELFQPRVALSNLDISGPLRRTNGSRQIPRILHQTTATKVIPDAWIQPQRSCMDTYSDFEYKLWTDESARDFLSVEYPWFLDTWDSYPFPIQRADALRYFVLYHYGGVYLDMDTWCRRAIPLPRLESETGIHRTILKSTIPTGITNDFMIASAKHPVYAAAIAKLPLSYAAITQHALKRLWARLQPHGAIMLSTGPLFLSLVVKDYLLQVEQLSFPSPTVGVINATELAPYLTDLEGGTWHRGDTKILMWIEDKPCIWFGAGAVVLVGGLYILDYLLIKVFEYRPWKVATHGLNPVKGI